MVDTYLRARAWLTCVSARLNTCVGQKNYAWFLATSLAVGVLTSFLLAVSGALLVDCFAYEGELRRRLHAQRTVLIPYDAVKSVLVVASALLLCTVGMVFQLIGFHAMLVCRGLTTYDFIINEQRREREKAAARKQPSGNAPKTALGRDIVTYEQFRATSKRLSREAEAGPAIARGEAGEGASLDSEVEPYDVVRRENV